ncbi:hypothetical protein [Mycobacterium sp. SMC-11]|uniref:hypothetical protein n=1 Tax=Mycobacterium sp. SMC-11 TaxID=3385969 RepID=UPI00390CD005
MTTEYPPLTDMIQIGADIDEAKTALSKIEVGDLPHLSQRIAYAQASATLAIAKLLYKTHLQ